MGDCNNKSLLANEFTQILKYLQKTEILNNINDQPAPETSNTKKKKKKKKKIKANLSELDSLLNKLRENEEKVQKQEIEKQSKLEFVKVCESFQANLEKISPEEDDFEDEMAKLKQDFAREILTYQQGMPIYSHRSQIISAVQEHDVTIIVAETGSGKSTQLVKYLHDETNTGQIVCTQPRKIAGNEC